jgi:hypothetical protein
VDGVDRGTLLRPVVSSRAAPPPQVLRVGHGQPVGHCAQDAPGPTPDAVRPRLLVVPGQEVLTADGPSVRISLTVTCRTADPRRWHEAVDDADALVHATVQVALREAVGARVLDDLLGARAALADDVRDRAGAVLRAGEAGGANVVLTTGPAHPLGPC